MRDTKEFLTDLEAVTWRWYIKKVFLKSSVTECLFNKAAGRGLQLY